MSRIDWLVLGGFLLIVIAMMATNHEAWRDCQHAGGQWHRGLCFAPGAVLDE